MLAKLVKVLKTSNWILTIFASGLAIMVFILPLSPEIALAWGKVKDRVTDQQLHIPADKNWLTINSIRVNGAILEGEDKKVMDEGLWRLPHSSTPDQGSNTVIVAHRYLFLSGGETFYHLDKLNLDEVINIRWQGKDYQYKVTKLAVVDPSQIEIESHTEIPTLTLYTCTPLWTANKRLVVTATLQSN